MEPDAGEMLFESSSKVFLKVPGEVAYREIHIVCHRVQCNRVGIMNVDMGQNLTTALHMIKSLLALLNLIIGHTVSSMGILYLFLEPSVGSW